MRAALELDYRTIDDCHDWMISWVDKEVERLGRCLEWDEAMDLLRSKLDLRTDGEEVLGEWLRGTGVDVVSWQIEGIPGVAWGNHETKEEAEEAVQRWLKRTGQKAEYEIVLVGRK